MKKQQSYLLLLQVRMSFNKHSVDTIGDEDIILPVVSSVDTNSPSRELAEIDTIEVNPTLILSN
jgi:hypothetical protein